MNNKRLLQEVVLRLEQAGIELWVFGGWAEELLGSIEPRVHKDIDLFYPAANFDAVDVFISTTKHEEIAGKRFAHKRAFLYRGIMVELFLVEQDDAGYFTNFWGTKKHYWPESIFALSESNLRTVSRETVADYRENYAALR